MKRRLVNGEYRIFFSSVPITKFFLLIQLPCSTFRLANMSQALQVVSTIKLASRIFLVFLLLFFIPIGEHSYVPYLKWRVYHFKSM